VRPTPTHSKHTLETHILPLSHEILYHCPGLPYQSTVILIRFPFTLGFTNTTIIRAWTRFTITIPYLWSLTSVGYTSSTDNVPHRTTSRVDSELLSPLRTEPKPSTGQYLVLRLPATVTYPLEHLLVIYHNHPHSFIIITNHAPLPLPLYSRRYRFEPTPLSLPFHSTQSSLSYINRIELNNPLGQNVFISM
jgi:hypothetical protein